MAINLKFWRTRTNIQTPLIQVPDVTENDWTRVMLYKKYWDFYTGKQFPYKRQDGEIQSVLNYCGPLVDKSVQFLVGKPFNIETEDEEALPILQSVWEGNSEVLKPMNIAQMGGVTGDAWVKPIYDDKTERLRLIVLNSMFCFPEFEESDFETLKKLKIIYPLGSTTDIRYFREEITAETITQYHDKEKVLEIPNVLGEIGVVHIPNLPVAGCYYGRSDLQDIIDLQIEFNEKLSDTSASIDYHASPITAIFGARAKQLEKGANRVWSGLPKDARVENIAGVGDLPATLRFLEILKLAFHELTQTPESALGKFQPISNTSGVAMHMAYLPLMEKTEVKRLTYGTGFQKINELILKIISIKQRKTFKSLTNWVTFAEPLPKDELIERQLIAQDIGAGIESQEGGMRRIGKTEEEIVQIQQEIMEEKARELALMYGTQEGVQNEEKGTKKKRTKKIRTGFEKQ